MWIITRHTQTRNWLCIVSTLLHFSAFGVEKDYKSLFEKVMETHDSYRNTAEDMKLRRELNEAGGAVFPFLVELYERAHTQKDYKYGPQERKLQVLYFFNKHEGDSSVLLESVRRDLAKLIANGEESNDDYRTLIYFGAEFLSKAGDESDEKLLAKFAKSKNLIIRKGATDSLKRLRESRNKSGNDLKVSRSQSKPKIIVAEHEGAHKEARRASETPSLANEPKSSASSKWPYIIVGIALLLILVIVLRAAKRKGKGGETEKPESP